MPLKLLAPTGNPRAQKILIAAKYSGIHIETTPDFNMGQDNLTPDFLEKNPLGKVPVLVTDEGSVWESNAIIRYIARLDENTQLFGRDDFEAGQVDQWIDFSVGEIELPARVWLGPIKGLIPYNPQATSKAKGDIRKVLQILNDHLADRTFLVGERITLADIAVSSFLVVLFKQVLDPKFRKPFTNVLRWFSTLIHQPNFKQVLGEVEMATTMASAEGAAEKSEEEKPEKKEKQKKEKQAKPKTEKPPKAEKKKKKDEDEEEEEDPALKEPEEPKGSNPLDQLPPTTLNLDEWKRTYSNNPASVANEWFWKNLDKNGWSIWFCDYLYNSELDAMFRTCNLVSGWMQRLDKLRKYGFGNVLIFADEEGHQQISGAWLFRGQEVPKEMMDCDDYVLYKWTRADPENPEDRKKVEEFWAWAGDFGGRKFSEQGKVFK